MGEQIDMEQAQLVIERIAQLAEAFAWQAGVAGMETAGGFVSYLAEHPRDIEPFLKFGAIELPLDWLSQGGLTWYAKDGKIISPAFARRARIIRSLATPGDHNTEQGEDA
jgi:hypothetical protein